MALLESICWEEEEEEEKKKKKKKKKKTREKCTDMQPVDMYFRRSRMQYELIWLLATNYIQYLTMSYFW